LKEEVLKAAVDLKDTTDRAKEYERSTISTIDIPHFTTEAQNVTSFTSNCNNLRRYARQLHVNGSEYGCAVRVAKVGASFTL
jgi:hypothetical protein